MMTYRKKPIEVEAEQFFPDIEPWPEGIRLILHGDETKDYYWMETLEGDFRVTPGDWIITGIKGEKYPCKPGIFAETYDDIP